MHPHLPTRPVCTSSLERPQAEFTIALPTSGLLPPHIQQPEQKPGVITIFSASLPTSHPPSKPECFCCLHASEFHLLSTPHLNSGHGFTQAHTDTTPSLHTCMIILLFSLEVLHVSQFRQYKILLPWHKLEFSSLSGPFINCRLYL